MIQYNDILITPRVIKRLINIIELSGSDEHPSLITLIDEAGIYILWFNITTIERERYDRTGVRLTSPLCDVVDTVLLKYLKNSLKTGSLPTYHSMD